MQTPTTVVVVLATVLEGIVPGVEGSGNVHAVAVPVGVAMDVYDEANDPGRRRHHRRRSAGGNHVDPVYGAVVVVIARHGHIRAVSVGNAIDPDRLLERVIRDGRVLPQAERQRAGESYSSSDFPFHVRLQTSQDAWSGD